MGLRIKNAFYKVYFSLIKKNINTYHHDIFQSKDKTLEINEKTAIIFRSLFKNCNNINQQYSLKNNVLFVSDNLNFYLNNKNDEIIIYLKLLKLLRKKDSRRKIIFKPHPNEIQRATHFLDIGFDFVIKDSISTEQICACYQVNKVVGFCSTALITSSQIFDINTISMVDYLDDSWLSNYGKSKINQFKNMTINLKNINFKFKL